MLPRWHRNWAPRRWCLRSIPEVAGLRSTAGAKKHTVTAFDMIRALEPFCDTFLYTHIDTEGLMGGIPMETVTAIRQATSRRLVVAGGIKTPQEIDSLDALGWMPLSGWPYIQAEISA
jgi:phosphoribosylformimino-5-aminoimidazole carboxamide ribotide isomerase